jgi:hypothetical protein
MLNGLPTELCMSKLLLYLHVVSGGHDKYTDFVPQYVAVMRILRQNLRREN